MVTDFGVNDNFGSLSLVNTLSLWLLRPVLHLVWSGTVVMLAAYSCLCCYCTKSTQVEQLSC
jgi:hypothetical protein